MQEDIMGIKEEIRDIEDVADSVIKTDLMPERSRT